ncbi:jg27559 [Pararge aegeria aegeria]|uniref:Jg27559 protein n=1 Tax=Pararge aegeria aegeria TaxID=348720 RepID=A0A8S4SNT0_9NEOP|nr:jg27559 [Pararge aegeria aegeria]
MTAASPNQSIRCHIEKINFFVPKKSVFDIKFEATPDDNTKERLVELFMNLTELDKLPSERCLEANDWHMKHALEYFIKLLKLGNLQSLMN